MLGQRPRANSVHVWSGRRVGHADDPGPVRAQQREEIEVAGIVDQHGIARLEQEAAEQVDRLRAAIRSA